MTVYFRNKVVSDVNSRYVYYRFTIDIPYFNTSRLLRLHVYYYPKLNFNRNRVWNVY